jgi:tetratricopeptide (TPR) repeat protein
LLLGLLRLRGASEQSASLADQFLGQLSGLGDGASVRLQRWQVLLAAGRYVELRGEVDALSGVAGMERERERVELLVGRSWLDEFDETAGRPRVGIELMMKWVPEVPLAAEVAEQLQRLRQAAVKPAVRTVAIDRLCRVVLSGGEWGEQAERELTELRAAGLSAEYLLGRVGDLAAAVGRYEQAVPWQRQALAAATERTYLRLNNLAICLLRAEGVGAAEECQSLIEEALGLSENHPQLLATRGEILLRRGQHVRARGDLEASLAAGSGSAEVWGLLAECCELSGDELMAERARAEQSRLEQLAAELN